MKVSLPAKLKKFIRKEVKSGRYKNAGAVVRHALRQLQGAESVTSPVKFLSSPGTEAGADSGIDFEEAAFTTLMQAAYDTGGDLSLIMAEVKAMNEAKKRLRELMDSVNQDASTNAGQAGGKPPLDFSTGMKSEEAYHQVELPVIDSEADGGFKLVLVDLQDGRLVDIAQLHDIMADLQSRLDGMNEMSEMASLRLQMIMDRIAKYLTTLSNIMKRTTSTMDALVQNLK